MPGVRCYAQRTYSGRRERFRNHRRERKQYEISTQRRVLDALQEAGHADDTLIVFVSDHGLAVGSHGLLGKQSLYEHSMRAPLMIAGPELPAPPAVRNPPTK